MILSSKAISVHICSKLCMVAFLSSISARYFHTIGVSSMSDAHFWCKYQHAPKDRKVTRHINVLFISKCIFPPFLQHTRKDRKIRPGPPVSRRRTFLSFPGLLYIILYIYIIYNNIIYIIYTFKYYIIYYIRCLEEASDWRYSDFWIPVLFPHSSCQATGAQDGCGRSLDNAFGSSHVLVLSWRT